MTMPEYKVQHSKLKIRVRMTHEQHLMWAVDAV